MVSSNDVQCLFLQAVFSRGILSFKHAQVLWEKCIDAVKVANPTLNIRFSDSRGDWDEFVANINDALNSLDLEFRHLMDEQTGVEMYAIVNTRGDEVAQMATEYTPVEIAYFKAVVEQIMLAPHEAYSVSSLAALREVNSLKANMTKTQAETVLASFVAKGWLLKSKRGRYSLSTRALLELLPYLKSNYADEFLECTICMEIVTRGVACNTPNCKARMHRHCFTKLRARHARTQCPACSSDWQQDGKNLIPVGEAAIKDGQDQGRRVHRRSVAEPSDEEGDEGLYMNGDESSQPSQPKRRGKQKKKAAAADMDVDEDEADEEVEEKEAPRKSQPRRSTRRR
ncbi:Nse1 non-SMC component of SMC5-6 complex-domain-containing protein [Phlebopus sp. FC_14]|nr:Nse1 non-SMC component of SMC5-6 complex-domain-containing protein [Phlebopus sp. FC_14]